MNKNPNGEIHLAESWNRLELVCRRLWDADSPAALELQAIVEEFKGEARRAEETVATLRRVQSELRDTLSREMERAYSEEIQALRLQLKRAEENSAGQDAKLAQREAHNQRLLQELAAKETQNLAFHERFLAESAEQDEARAQKMETFYKGVQAKEAALEARWEARHAALEEEHKQRAETLKKKHEELLAELKTRAAGLEDHYSTRETELELGQKRLQADREAWDANRLAESQTMSKRREELALQAESLAGEYKKKQVELQRIKEAMQSELAEVVRQYQARMRDPGSQPGGMSHG
jgi:uncharacterized protein YukE